jgi:hypothetical protein
VIKGYPMMVMAVVVARCFALLWLGKDESRYRRLSLVLSDRLVDQIPKFDSRTPKVQPLSLSPMD